ncbi:unnamed protein product [Arabis nemorensis]|uniref:Uncharacterized protein n=1 Tax=Arabis nemorensis TaxID=586526 RepID=A0A565BRF5_9BRAS|nr:unnamed protein product [Arabis nemorensis]
MQLVEDDEIPKTLIAKGLSEAKIAEEKMLHSYEKKLMEDVKRVHNEDDLRLIRAAIRGMGKALDQALDRKLVEIDEYELQLQQQGKGEEAGLVDL